MTEIAGEALAETVAPSPRSQVAEHAGITFAGLMAANVLAYVFNTLVSRVLGVEAYGTFSSLVAIVLMVSAPAVIAQMVVAKLASDLASDPDRLAGVVRIVDRVTLAVSLAAGAALAAASEPLARFLHIGDPLLIVFAGASLCGAVALPFLRGVLQGRQAFGHYALSTIAENVGKVVFAPMFALMGGLRGAVGGLALGYAAAAVYTFFTGMPHRRGNPVPLALRALVWNSVPIAIAVLCVNVLLLYDLVLSKRYLDGHTVGLYGAAALASRALYAVIAFVPTVLLPQAAARSLRGERTRGLFAQALGVSGMLVVATIVFFALFPRLVVVVIAGRPFAAGAAFVVPYVCAIGALSLANVVATYNIARARMRFVIPLACVTLGEILSVVVRHRSAGDFLQTIAVGHTLALLAAATSLGDRTRGSGDAKARRAEG